MRSHTGEKPYKCKECDYSAADSSSLCKHQRIHTDERPFKCQICPYASRNSSQLTVHLRSHTGDAPFHCILCNSKFKINSDLKRHMRVHTGEKPYRCEFCDFYCAMKGNLKSHIRMKHNAESTHKCNQCDFHCGSKADLRQHLRSHLPEQPVKCLECSYSCANRAALKVHERIHSNDRPFKCHFCKFDTKQRSNLTTHIKKVHGDQVKEKSDPQKTEGNFQRPSMARKNNKVDAKKTFKCDLCEASFVREDSLRSHKKQHNEYIIQKNQTLSVLQISIDASPETDDLTMESPSKANPTTTFITGKVGQRLQDKDETETSPNLDKKMTNNQLQMLSHVNLMASPQTRASPSNDDVPAAQADSDPINEELIGNGADQRQGSPANRTFINAAGMTCSDLEGLNVLIHEEPEDVTVVRVGDDDSAAPNSPDYPSPPADSPKEKYIIIQDDESPDVLCPADAIPD